MPLFDFRCTACAHVFEALVLKATVPACPQCGAAELEKLLSLPAVRSSATTDLAMRSARRRDQAQAKEQAYTQRQYELNHD